MKYRQPPTSFDAQNILAKTIFQRAVTVSKSVSKKYRKVIQSSFGLCLICLENWANYIQKVAISGTNPTPSATLAEFEYNPLLLSYYSLDGSPTKKT